jgi:proline iminopeptidase
MDKRSLSQGTIAVPGGNIWYCTSRGAGKKTPLLVVHGGPGVPHNYLTVLNALSDERPVIWYDQLGCGNSEKPDDNALWTVDRFADELAEVRNALIPDEVHLLGQSWGAYLVTAYFLKHKPTGIRSITLSAPLLSTSRWLEDQRHWLSGLPQEMQEAINRCEAVGDYAAEAYQEAMSLFYNRHVCRLDPWPEEVLSAMDGMAANVYNYMWGPSEFTVTGTLRDADLTSRLPEITVPVLFTCGSYDEATPETVKSFHKLVPGSELEIFPDASHMHHLECKEAFLTVLSSFLSRNDQ